MNGAVAALLFLESQDPGSREASRVRQLLSRPPGVLTPRRAGLASWVLLDLLSGLGRTPFGLDGPAARLAGRVAALHALEPVAARRSLFVAAAISHTWPRVRQLAAEAGLDDPAPDAWLPAAPALLTAANLTDAVAELEAAAGPRRPRWLLRRAGRLSRGDVTARCDALARTPTVLADFSHPRGQRLAVLPTLLAWPHQLLPGPRACRRAVAAVPAALAVAAGVPHAPVPAGTDPARLLPTVAELMAGGPGPVGHVAAATEVSALLV